MEVMTMFYIEPRRGSGKGKREVNCFPSWVGGGEGRAPFPGSRVSPILTFRITTFGNPWLT